MPTSSRWPISFAPVCGTPKPVQHRLTVRLLAIVAQIQQRMGWRLLFLRVDDALCPKDVATHALDAVSLQYDHVTKRRQKGRCTNSSRYVSLSVQCGPVQLVLGWRLYLPHKVVKRLNRTRDASDHLTYHKLTTLVEQLLDEVAPHLPAGCKVYVLFDAWYDNHHLQKHIRAHGWHWICAHPVWRGFTAPRSARARHRTSRSNRNVSDRPLCHWWSHLNDQRITPVVVRSSYQTSPLGPLLRFLHQSRESPYF